MGGTLRILSGGAAQALVAGLREQFSATSGFDVQGTFGAVGAMRDKLLGGELCDVLVLTQALIEQFTAQGHVVAGTAAPLGKVKTGVAVKSGEPMPDVSTSERLKAALLQAPGIYFPDPEKATAGIHFMKVLNTLGIADEVASRIRTFPNGAAAMRAMSESTEKNVVGCTQVTEILYADGVELVGLLPKEFELATVYTAAVCEKASAREVAGEFVRLLSGEDAAPLRARCGFES